MAKEKGKYDGLLCFLLALIVVLILVIGGGAYYFLVLDNGEEIVETNINTVSKPETPKEENNTQETKEIVYSYFNKTISDINYESITYNVPHININSEDVLKINKEIEEFYEPGINYALGKEHTGVPLTMDMGIRYNYSINNNILSLLILAGCETDDFQHPKTYNIDINTGKRLTNSEVIASKYRTDKEYLEILTSKCKKLFTNAFGNSSEDYANELRKGNWSEEDIKVQKNAYELSLKYTLDNCSMETQLFLDMNNNINAVTEMGILAGNGRDSIIIDLGI